MNTVINPENLGEAKDEDGYRNPPDLTPRREGGADASAEIMPNDNRADEKVISNKKKDKEPNE